MGRPGEARLTRNAKGQQRNRPACSGSWKRHPLRGPPNDNRAHSLSPPPTWRRPRARVSTSAHPPALRAASPQPHRPVHCHRPPRVGSHPVTPKLPPPNPKFKSKILRNAYPAVRPASGRGSAARVPLPHPQHHPTSLTPSHRGQERGHPPGRGHAGPAQPCEPPRQRALVREDPLAPVGPAAPRARRDAHRGRPHRRVVHLILGPLQPPVPHRPPGEMERARGRA